MLRHQPPLPETADELCKVARSLGAGPADVYLGARATERMVKDLSAKGALSKVRAIHFATHGLLAGETAWFLNGRPEPALTYPSARLLPSPTWPGTHLAGRQESGRMCAVRRPSGRARGRSPGTGWRRTS